MIRVSKKVQLLLVIILVGGIVSYKLGETEVSYGEAQEEDVITIKVALWDYDYQSYDRKLMDAFMEDNPKIHVDVISAPNVYYGKKITSWLTGNEGIDVVYFSSFAQAEKMQQNNLLQPMTKYIDNDHINLESYPRILEQHNETFAIPYRRDWSVLYYNKDIFNEAGVGYPTEEMTWFDYQQLADKLTENLNKTSKYGCINSIASSFMTAPLYMIHEDMDYTQIDFEILSQRWHLIADMQEVDKSTPTAQAIINNNMDQRIFELGTIGMMVDGTWFANYLKEGQESSIHSIDWGMVKLPTWERDNDSAQMGYLSMISLTKKSQHPDAAWKFIKYVTGKEGAKRLAQELIMPAYKDKEIRQEYMNSPFFPSGSESAILDSKVIYQWENAENSMDTSEIYAYINQMTQDILLENIEIEEALTSVRDAYGK